MKHIVIDARLYGPKHTGIGRYTKNLLSALSRLPDFKKYKFSLIVDQKLQTQVKKDLKNKYKLVPVDTPHYSLSEQTKLPTILKKLNPDLVHFTHFNKPVIYFGKSVVTIHDLIKHFYKGQETTTRNPILYWPKYLCYRLLTSIIINQASRLIVPSNFWKQYLQKITSTPITVTPEAVDPKFIAHKSYILNHKSYLLYTGNLYPHKNIDIILKALPQLPNLKLKIISQKNIFQQRLIQKINQLNLQNQVEFLGFLPDSEFKNAYRHALALVHPSKMEGFSLTGLEAMALNCPVISSNSSCLPEVYGKSVLYFDPDDVNQLISQIKKLQSSKTLRQKLIRLGHQQVAKYSWQKTASLTLKIYEQVLQ